jgi:hypothetical protein
MRGGELVWVGSLTELFDLRQFPPAQLEKIALKFRIKHDISFDLDR